MKQEDIPLDQLMVSTLNARKDLQAGQEDSGIEELASSIRQQGLLSPPIVRPHQDGKYEVLVGQRRLLACRKLGLDPVPCLIRDDLGDADAVALSLVENVHRADMHPLDKARALKALYDRHGSYDRVARETAWSGATVRKYIQLLDLPPELQVRVGTANGPSGVGTLARLASTFSGNEAVQVFDRISGFSQRIQEEILKQSGGDVHAIDDLVADAQEGAFDVRRCGGIYGCQVIGDIIRQRITEAGFQDLVRQVAENVGSAEVSDKAMQEAARAFWRAVAVG